MGVTALGAMIGGGFVIGCAGVTAKTQGDATVIDECLATKNHVEGTYARLKEGSSKVENGQVVALEVTFIEVERAKDGMESEVSVIDSAAATSLMETLRSLPRSTSTKYPRVNSTEGSPIVIKSVVNQPIVSNPTNGENRDAQIEYVPIGTVVGSTISRLERGRMKVGLDITLSDIIGTEHIGGNDYPIVSSHIYSAEHEISKNETIHLKLAPLKGRNSTINVFANVLTDDQLVVQN